MVVRKRFGQHFLESAWVTKVIQEIGPRPDEAFLEIGPGRGALTRALLERAQSVMAVEIDRDLAAGLRDTDDKLTVIEGDFLEVAGRDRDWGTSALRVVGNLPYNVASPILFALMDLYAVGAPVVDATLMLQREVADRLLAGPGGREYGVLSILVQYTADVSRLLNLPPGAFRPAPKVQSTLVRVRFRPPATAAVSSARFASLVRAIFTRRRKTLANALLAFSESHVLAPAVALERAELDRRRRPETLSVGELVRLADVYGPPTTSTVITPIGSDTGKA
jgi:16S rRNA (adenine1518-N6/adenine1519-N6)-dimethyltransferase